ncbi:MAG: sigma-70 family RNA polymerase sigma factor [Planctomycetota bacterium]
MNPIQKYPNVDANIWQNVLNGDPHSFEAVVNCYQGAVSAVAFNIVGDFATSQDIAQDTFWAAWAEKDKLLDANKLPYWLCGIARNLARQWRRKKIRRKETNPESIADQSTGEGQQPIDEFISHEEESIVWQALEEMPENYREVVVLYYRQGKSIEEVAQTLGVANATARQRLHRGREMLKSHVAKLVEGVLDRNNPNQTFTARVMAGIVGVGVAGQTATATASTGGVTATASLAMAKVLAAGPALGLFGGFAGILGGMFGAWLGNWLPAQLAPTETERQLLLERGRGAFNQSLFLIVGDLVTTALFVTQTIDLFAFLIALLIVNGLFALMLTVHVVVTSVLVSRLRKELSPWEDPNRSPLARKVAQRQMNQPKQQRRYTSRWTLLGLPLIDIQISDPPQLNQPTKPKPDRRSTGPRIARGWIAIGDVACGVLVGIGGRAYGFFAVGGLAFGVVAIGGAAVGMIALGGAAVGAISLGGAALGFIALGGLAIGWKIAVGGGAFAYYLAVGGWAMAHDFAIGGGALANEANTEAATQVVRQLSIIALLKQSQMLWSCAVAAAIALGAALNGLMFRTERPEDSIPSDK